MVAAVAPSDKAWIVLSSPQANDRSDGPIGSSVWTDRPGAEALLAYVSRGATTSARRVAPAVEKHAIELLDGNFSDPLGATIAGYFMLTMGAASRRRSPWLKKLADSYENMSDGALIYGASLLRGPYELGRHFQARSS